MLQMVLELYQHLHSTIFKLKQSIYNSKVYKEVDLHSTIFKLKLNKQFNRNLATEFTFYYI